MEHFTGCGSLIPADLDLDTMILFTSYPSDFDWPNLLKEILPWADRHFVRRQIPHRILHILLLEKCSANVWVHDLKIHVLCYVLRVARHMSHMHHYVCVCYLPWLLPQTAAREQAHHASH